MNFFLDGDIGRLGRENQCQIQVVGQCQVGDLPSIHQHRSSTSRSSHQRCSTKKGALKNLAKFTGKHLRQSLF